MTLSDIFGGGVISGMRKRFVFRFRNTGSGNTAGSNTASSNTGASNSAGSNAGSSDTGCSNGIGCNICPLTGMLPDTDREVRIHSRNV